MKIITALLGFLILLSFLFYNLPANEFETVEEQAEEKTPDVIESSGISSTEEDGEVSPIIILPSTAGEVSFPHEMHFEELGLECELCHHEINASALNIPHEEYFDDFWIDCAICHRTDGSAKLEAESCSTCHHASPVDIADETLSSTVVIHKNCWGCHEIGTGSEASSNCSLCHIGEKAEF